MSTINLLVRDRTNYLNLRKGAERKLERLNAAHVVFGVERNAKGQLSTFYRVFFDDESLWAYDRTTDQRLPIEAVHR